MQKLTQIFIIEIIIKKFINYFFSNNFKKIIFKGKIYENLTDIYLRCENIPILLKKIFVRIANERDYRLKSVNQLCRERHILLYKWKQ